MKTSGRKKGNLREKSFFLRSLEILIFFSCIYLFFDIFIDTDNKSNIIEKREKKIEDSLRKNNYVLENDIQKISNKVDNIKNEIKRLKNKLP